MTTIRVWALLLACMLPIAADAADVLKVHGENTKSLTVKSGQAMAVGFEVTRELKNVTIEFNSAGIGSKGGIAINKDEVGTKSRFSQTIGGAGFEDNQKPGSVLKIEQLSPGRYFVVVCVDEGSVVFGGSGSDIQKEENGATRLVDYYAEQKENHAPKSDFEVLLGHGLHFTIHEAP